jgi:hypothetical protein
LSGTSATFLGEGPIAHGKGSWLLSVRRSYLDYLIKRIDPENGFGFGFVDAQAKATYDINSRHQLSIITLVGRARFDEGDPGIGVNEIQTGISRAWLTSLSWRYLASPRFAITQRLFWTGLRYQNDNRDGAMLDAARSSELGWRADAPSPGTRVLVEFGGDAERLDGSRTIQRQLSPASPQVTLNDYDERAAAGSAYGQVRIGLGSRVTVAPGARVDYWSATAATTASPWVTAEFRLSERTRLRGGSGVYRQFPDLEAVHGIHGGGSGLQSERALHVDVGVEHTLLPQTRLLFNVYTRHESDVLWTPGAEPGSRRPAQSAGPFSAPRSTRWAEARGAEIVVRRDATDGSRLGRLRLRPAAV